MKNRDIVIRLRDWFLALPFIQMKAVTKQIVIDNISPSLDTYELEQLDKWSKSAINFLTLEWIRQEKLDIISGYMRQSRLDAVAAEKIKVVNWLISTKGLSQPTSEALYDDCNVMLEADNG